MVQNIDILEWFRMEKYGRIANVDLLNGPELDNPGIVQNLNVLKWSIMKISQNFL